MAVAVILISVVLTNITEKITASRFGKYELEEEIEEKPMTKRELRGLLFAIFGGTIYLIIFLYNIIPGLPFSGNLLDNSQILYIDKLFSYNSFFSNGFVFIVTIFFIILGLFYGLGARTIKDHKDFVSSLGYSLDGVGETIVLIFVASLFISVFKNTYIGETVVAALASIFQNTNFQGVALIILLFIVSMISTLVLPGSISKWEILSPVVIPVFMNAGMTPEFAQVIFRFGESVTMGLTPIMAYFVIYLAILNKNTKDKKSVNILTAIKYQIPYAILTGLVLIALLILWYIIGLPLGINGSTVL